MRGDCLPLRPTSDLLCQHRAWPRKMGGPAWVSELSQRAPGRTRCLVCSVTGELVLDLQSPGFGALVLCSELAQTVRTGTKTELLVPTLWHKGSARSCFIAKSRVSAPYPPC
ncbi:hypothetical protein GHT09_001451 [Marmota monax]|uniref:Uncharacterized protein n=1 Tax=Marmota monax TaxID=9995 RepID=A0A834QZ47_MARMO|nr:hypothetical protein GHT09_001451 [Marmota monax]